jgi:hypothetical protein
MLSNYSEATMAAKAMSLGARQYLVKMETTPLEVAAIVGRWLVPHMARA